MKETCHGRWRNTESSSIRGTTSIERAASCGGSGFGSPLDIHGLTPEATGVSPLKGLKATGPADETMNHCHACCGGVGWVCVLGVRAYARGNGSVAPEGLKAATPRDGTVRDCCTPPRGPGKHRSAAVVAAEISALKGMTERSQCNAPGRCRAEFGESPEGMKQNSHGRQPVEPEAQSKPGPAGDDTKAGLCRVCSIPATGLLHPSPDPSSLVGKPPAANSRAAGGAESLASGSRPGGARAPSFSGRGSFRGRSPSPRDPAGPRRRIFRP